MLVNKNRLDLFENIPNVNLLGSISESRAYYKGWFVLKKYDEALDLYDQAIKTVKNYYKVWNNKGLLLHSLGHLKNKKYFNLAKDCYDKAIKIKSDFPDAYWNKSLSQLTLGEFEEGWKNYEYRFKLPNAKTEFFKLPRLESLQNINKKYAQN